MTYYKTNLPFVLGNPHQLLETIDCLVENALKFTPAGGRVRVGAYSERDWVNLVVSDTGIGIKEEQLDQIFSIFYQVNSSPIRRYRGLGLAKAVVEAHGGRLEVESIPKEGSQFTIKLPAVVHLECGPDEVSPNFRHILLVDDEEQVTTSLQLGLEKMRNYEVVTANSSEQALHLLTQQSFDLVITDYWMPSINGLVLAKHIRYMCPQAAIIMLTAFGSDKLREQASSVGVRHFLDKPVKFTQLRNLVLETLEENSLAGYE
jgi:CheY-like chemotaxis protein